MNTIRTTLLILAMLCGIMPAMADVNFTEKTPFYYDKEVSDVSIVTQAYLGVTDANGITLNSSKNALRSTAHYNEDGTMLCWQATSCETGNKSYTGKYFQIHSADKDIKSVRLLLNKAKSKYVIVGWKEVVDETADYCDYATNEAVDDLRWVVSDLSQMEGIRTIRIYANLKSSDLYYEGKVVDKGSDGQPYIYGIQVGLSSNSTSIGTYGFAAFSSTAALDFTNVTDCNAYYADSYAGGTLHLTKVTGVVPANFGLLLCAPTGTTTPVCIPIATAEQANACTLKESDNAFVATSTGTYSPANASDALALGVKSSKAGFYYVGAGVTVPLNKMYLPASNVARAKSVTLDFDGIDPTGIVEINNNDAAVSPSAQRPATDLLGRPCPNPVPGQMYIKDGRVIIK